ncbi:MAG: hypothetical protein MJ245_03365 [Clostridia bacterium]|nr:hypothetical protein [Clostridia bacterium]
MVDKIIRTCEIAMWIILGCFVVTIGYMFISFLVSYIDLKPNKVGPTFAITKTLENSVLELNDEAKEYVSLEIKELESDNKKVYITLLPLKETTEAVEVNINEKQTEVNEETKEEIKTTYQAKDVRVKNSILAVNKLSCNIEEEFDLINVVNE